MSVKSVPIERDVTPGLAYPALAGSDVRAPSVAAVVVCILLVALTLRPGIVSMGPLLTAIIDELGLTHTQASLLTTIPTLLMGLLALPAPWLAHRFGRDRIILLALIVLGAAIILRALAGSIGQLFASTAAVGAGIAVAGTLFSSYVKARSPNRIALFMGIYATAIGLGSTVAAVATGPIDQLIGDWRWAGGFWVLPALLAISMMTGAAQAAQGDWLARARVHRCAGADEVALELEDDLQHLPGDPEHPGHAAGGQAAPDLDHQRVARRHVRVHQRVEDHERTRRQGEVDDQADEVEGLLFGRGHARHSRPRPGFVEQKLGRRRPGKIRPVLGKACGASVRAKR